MSDHYQKQTGEEYNSPTFSGFKNTYVTNELKHPFCIVDNKVWTLSKIPEVNWLKIGDVKWVSKIDHKFVSVCLCWPGTNSTGGQKSSFVNTVMQD